MKRHTDCILCDKPLRNEIARLVKRHIRGMSDKAAIEISETALKAVFRWQQKRKRTAA